MVAVVYCGSSKDSEMIGLLLSAIHAVHASVLHITSKTLSLLPQNAAQADLLLIDNAGMRDFHLDKGIVLFGRMPNPIPDFKFPENFIAIVEPDNEEAIKIIRKNSLQAVTCGLSQRDTLTFSSLDSDRAVISLQREIQNLEGKPVFPHEIPVTFSSTHGEYCLLASAAVLLTSGIHSLEEGLQL